MATKPRKVAARKTARVSSGTSRTILLLSILGVVTALNWHGSLDAQATTGLLGIILGGIVHASGTKQGSDATTNPPDVS